MLTTKPILRIVDPNKDFVVCTDASKDGLGGFLTKDGHVVFYESRKLKEHEKNYLVHNMELAAIIQALKIWQDYVVGKKSFLLTNNDGLKYLFDQNKLNAHHAKCIAFLSEYYFEINHIEGKENIVTDVIRQQHELHIILVSEYEPKFKKLLKEVSKEDPKYKILLEKCNNRSKDTVETMYQINSKGFI